MHARILKHAAVWAVLAASGWLVAGTALAGAGCAACAGCRSAPAAEEAKEVKEADAPYQTHCPVMGGPIDRALYVDHENTRIFVCCAGCVETVKADPAKHIAALEAEGVTPYRVQTHCPVMTRQRIQRGRSRHVDHEGQRIYVCCGSCHRTVSRNPERYSEALEKDGIALDKAEE